VEGVEILIGYVIDEDYGRFWITAAAVLNITPAVGRWTAGLKARNPESSARIDVSVLLKFSLCITLSRNPRRFFSNWRPIFPFSLVSKISGAVDTIWTVNVVFGYYFYIKILHSINYKYSRSSEMETCLYSTRCKNHKLYNY